MEDEVKNRFEHTEKRLEDFKVYAGGIVGLFALAFGVVTVLMGLNFSSEKTELREFRKDLKEEIKFELGKKDPLPDIELRHVNGGLLPNQDVTASLETNPDGTPTIRFRYVIKNKGGSVASSLFVKIYTSEPLALYHHSADDSNYKYEAYISTEELRIKSVPAGASLENDFWIGLTATTPPPSGRYSVALKFYYGKAQMAQAAFQLIIANATQG
jgi:hypothetical protein